MRNRTPTSADGTLAITRETLKNQLKMQKEKEKKKKQAIPKSETCAILSEVRTPDDTS